MEGLYICRLVALMFLFGSGCTYEEVQVTMEEIENVCNMTVDTGPCKASLTRWYFNGKKCEVFQFGGCKGNGNNFMTLQECRDQCPSVDCTYPLDKGPCKAKLPRYYYNSNAGKCMEFNYGGCKGNTNNFISYEECFDACHRK